jgi:hypothetical protein
LQPDKAGFRAVIPPLNPAETPAEARMPDESLVDYLVKIGWDASSAENRNCFFNSELFEDLKAGRCRVQVMCAVADEDYEDWSQTPIRVILPPEFWRLARYGFHNHDRVTGFYIWHILGRGKSRTYFDPIVLDAEKSSAGDPETHSGMAGRPTPRHLYDVEFKRRCDAREVLPEIAKEADALWEWLKATHPNLNPGTRLTIENNIRERHRALRPSTK